MTICSLNEAGSLTRVVGTSGPHVDYPGGTVIRGLQLTEADHGAYLQTAQDLRTASAPNLTMTAGPPFVQTMSSSLRHNAPRSMCLSLCSCTRTCGSSSFPCRHDPGPREHSSGIDIVFKARAQHG